MKHSGVLWSTVMYHEAQWCTMKHSEAQCCIVKHSDCCGLWLNNADIWLSALQCCDHETGNGTMWCHIPKYLIGICLPHLAVPKRTSTDMFRPCKDDICYDSQCHHHTFTQHTVWNSESPFWTCGQKDGRTDKWRTSRVLSRLRQAIIYKSSPWLGLRCQSQSSKQTKISKTISIPIPGSSSFFFVCVLYSYATILYSLLCVLLNSSHVSFWKLHEITTSTNVLKPANR